MGAVVLWTSANLIGADVLRRSVTQALAVAASSITVDPWDGRSAPPPDAAAALLMVSGMPSDVGAAVVAIRHLAGGMDAGCRLVVFCPIDGGVSLSEARTALAIDPVLWPLDSRALVAADRSGLPVQAAEPRSRLSAAIVAAAAALTATLRRVPPRTLDSDEVVRRVSARVWTTLEGRSTGDGVEAAIDHELAAFLGGSGGVLPPGEKDAVTRRLRQDLLGFGPIEPFFDDPSVSEIMVNGAGHIFVEREGRVSQAPVAYASDERLRLAISRIVSPAGRRVDLSSPLCDVRLPDGSRANVVLPPVSVGGPVLTVRRFRPAFERLEDLIRVGALDEAQARQLTEAVRSRKNILVAGNSGAGKTTLLNALAALIDDEERIITMEDAAELRIRKPHVVRLETRPPNAEGSGEITMRDLVINALRMRPDRLIVGECRGAEAVPMLQAMNTGHDGSMTTLHANSASDAIERLESMALIGASHWPVDVVRRQIVSALHVVVYLRRAGPVRRLEAIVDLREARR